MFSSLPVLMYHSISRQPGKLHVSPELLDEQCRYLKTHGWRGISLAEAEDSLLRGKKLPRKACLLTFDDGYLNNYVYAEPILKSHGHCGVIFTVVGLMEEGNTLAPNLEDIAENPERESEVAFLHERKWVTRAGYRVNDIKFCNWEEIRRMHERGVMEAVPHSMGHDRIVSSLEFSDLYRRQWKWGYFAVTPYTPPYGMPLFPTGYSLATRGYILNPDLFALVKKMVPQRIRKARVFLADPVRREKLLKAIRKLPSLGRLETEEEFRARLFADFTACREQFITRLGREPVSFCWPWGEYCPEAIEEGERAGFRLFFCTSQTAGQFRNSRPVRRVGVRYYTSPEMVLRKVRLFSWEPLGALFEKQIKYFPDGLPWAKKKR